jgi:tRNA pseudouridine13 synthase
MPLTFGAPAGEGVIRERSEDFQVDEILGFEPAGDGQHVFLQLRKRDTNTLWLARQIALFAGVSQKDLGYAGLKDRYGVTSQWFSVDMAGRPEPDWRGLESAQVQLLQVARNPRKLRIGALQGNRFRLRICRLQADLQILEQRLRQLRDSGMPNYFGEQRFGHDYSNLDQAQAMFERRLGRVERKLRGLLISAARSQLFNEVLAERIEQASWDRPMIGDYFCLDGSRSGFATEQLDENLNERCRSMDIHPSGPLWGRGWPPVSGETLLLEQMLLEPYGIMRNGLEHVGLQQERRALRVRIGDLRWELTGQDELLLEFSLPAGSYATVLLRELLCVESARAPTPDSG